MPSRRAYPRQSINHIPRALCWMVLFAGILLVLGSLNVYSTTYYMDIEGGGSPYEHFFRQIIFLALSLAAGKWVSCWKIDTVRRLNFPFLLVTLGLLVLVMFIGQSVNGANRWLKLGSLSIQPSEFAKLTAVIWASQFLSVLVNKRMKISFVKPLLDRRFLSRGRGGLKKYYSALILPIAAPLLLSLFIILQPDMGTAVLVLLFPLLLYVLAGLSSIDVVLMGAVTLAAGSVLVIRFPYRMERITAFLHPEEHAQDIGYQTMQSLIAVGSGGTLGQGIGQGMSKFLYLPEQFTDFAFAVFAQEYGFFISAFVICLYVGFLACGFSLASHIRSSYSSLLVYGLTMMISVQGFLNIAMVLGVFPVTGVPLPFISYGGTSLLVNVVSLGLIWGTVRKNYRKQYKEDKEKELQERARMFQNE
jgi:cell division protein FtsW